jgi:hypothetical protein
VKASSFRSRSFGRSAPSERAAVKAKGEDGNLSVGPHGSQARPSIKLFIHKARPWAEFDSLFYEAALDQWIRAAGVQRREGYSEPSLGREKSHDLRRTCAQLCHTSGGELEQIQFLPGTTRHSARCFFPRCNMLQARSLAAGLDYVRSTMFDDPSRSGVNCAGLRIDHQESGTISVWQADRRLLGISPLEDSIRVAGLRPRVSQDNLDISDDRLPFGQWTTRSSETKYKRSPIRTAFCITTRDPSPPLQSFVDRAGPQSGTQRGHSPGKEEKRLRVQRFRSGLSVWQQTLAD